MIERAIEGLVMAVMLAVFGALFAVCAAAVADHSHVFIAPGALGCELTGPNAGAGC